MNLPENPNNHDWLAWDANAPWDRQKVVLYWYDSPPSQDEFLLFRTERLQIYDHSGGWYSVWVHRSLLDE